MTLAVDIASWVLLLLGSFFTVAGAFGLVRMPDVFTRIHAASVTDTLGVGLLLLGMCLQSGFSLVTIKLLFLLALFFFTGPVVAHALSQACLHENIKPVLTEDRRGAGRPQPESPAGSAGEGRRS
jgi:multicomponent Na+:H+ antiporter subunit G